MFFVYRIHDGGFRGGYCVNVYHYSLRFVGRRARSLNNQWYQTGLAAYNTDSCTFSNSRLKILYDRVLAVRIRKSGVPVYGFGKSSAVESLKQACISFLM